MIYTNTPEEDARTILGENINGNLETLTEKLRRFHEGDRLALDDEFFERYRRKPTKKDLVFQAIKDKTKEKDERIRRLFKEGNKFEEIEREADEALQRIRTADLSSYFVQLYFGQSIIENPFDRDNKTISDVPYQFLLVKDKRYLANAGFFPYRGRIEVSQIQGFPGCEIELEPLKWSRFLIRCISEWANDARIPEVNVTPHEKNGWDSVMYNSKGNSHLVYDVSARREGFSYDKSRQLFVKRTGVTS